ncbi:MAG: VWA domain-containing protein [Clostridia bacterium]|nr:VWA domain-containing protein [Clostridia bacterium]
MSSVTYLGSREMLIGENRKARVGFVVISPEVPIQSQTNHHILLADVSGSMSGSINTLKERLIATLKALMLVPDSYVSVITYSGHNQSKRVVTGVRCDEKSYTMADVWNVIEEELYIKSVTVISEPLEQSIKICKSLADVCSKHHIALFTDGCLVPTHWNEKTEREKCFKIAEICCNEGIFLNAIGFGQYYDRAFLKELIEIAGNGTVVHIDEIKDYSEVILKVILKVNAEKLLTVDLEARDGKILNLSSSILKSTMRVRNFLPAGNIFALWDSSSLVVDGENYELDPNLAINDPEICDRFYYSLARYYAQEEDMDSMELIIKALGDLALFENVQNCYSFTEKGNAINQITDLLENPNQRFSKGRNPIVETPAEKICILEILQSILQDRDSMLYWDTNTSYHRITQHSKQLEDNIVFKRTEKELIPVTSISIGSEKLNIGIKVRLDGEVLDKTSGLRKAACIYRDFNIVNSGNINVPYLHARLSRELFEKFELEGILQQNNSGGYIPEAVYRITLQGIKSTNKRVLKSMSMSEIAENLYRISELKCKQWAINQLIKEITSLNDKLTFTELPQEEQEIRRILRINPEGIYSPASIEKDNDSPFEIYPAVFLTWDILKFPEKKTKESYLNEYKDEITDMRFLRHRDDKDLYEYLSRELTQVRNEMRNRELKVNSVRIASAITNKSPFLWEETGEKSKTCTDKVLNRNMVIGGKLTFSKKTISDKIIEQQKWVQLIKCN